MKTIHLELPEDIERQLSTISKNQQVFILEAIKEKIKKNAAAAEELKNKLIEGYQATYEEDMGLASDFESSDLEGWK